MVPTAGGGRGGAGPFWGACGGRPFSFSKKAQRTSKTPPLCRSPCPLGWGAAPSCPASTTPPPNSGYVFICFDGNDSQATAATQTIQVLILYNFSPVTPLAQVVGASLIQVEASTTMQVQKQQ